MSHAFAMHPLTRKIPSLLRRAQAALARGLPRRDGPAASLQGLSPSAKRLLRRILEEEGRTLRAPTLAGAAIGLELGDVIAIYREPPDGTFVLALNDWAAEQLRRHPELLAA